MRFRVLLSPLKVLILWGMVCSPVPAAASGPPAPGEPPPNTIGPLITDTAVPIGQGNWSIQPLAQFNINGGRFSPNWRRVSAPGDFYSLQLPVIFTYGPLPNVEMVLTVPYQHNWARNALLAAAPGEGSANFGGLGDTTLNLKYQFFEETALRPTCTALMGFGFPTGHHRRLNPLNLGTDLLGSGAYTFTGGLNLSKWLPPVYLYANLWYTIPTTATVDGIHLHDRDLVTLNLAGEWVLTKQWAVLVEFNSLWWGGNLLGPRSRVPPRDLLSMVGGLEYNYSQSWSFAAGVSVDVAGKNIPFNYAPILTCKYSF